MKQTPCKKSVLIPKCHDNDYVVVQFYPWFKFSFLLFQNQYHTYLPYPKTKENKIYPRKKLNHNNYNKSMNADIETRLI